MRIGRRRSPPRGPEWGRPRPSGVTQRSRGGRTMTETVAPRPPGRTAPQQPPAEPERTGWVGWIYFAGTLAILAGSFQAIAGLAAIFNDDYFLVRSKDLVISVDYTGWGWIHLALGVLLVAAGVGMCLGQLWARIVGVVLCGLSALANFLFIAAYPVWGAITIAIDVLVIYALAAHGREAK